MRVLWGYDDDQGLFIEGRLHVKVVFGCKKN